MCAPWLPKIRNSLVVPRRIWKSALRSGSACFQIFPASRPKLPRSLRSCGDLPSPREGGEIRILIADDSEAFRRAVKDLLNENSREWVVCGEATDGEDAVRKVAKLLPDVILLDLSIPLLHGFRVAKILKRDYPALVVIVMSEQDISVLSRMADAAGTRYCIMPKSRAALDLIPMLLSLRRNSEEQSDLRSD